MINVKYSALSVGAGSKGMNYESKKSTHKKQPAGVLKRNPSIISHSSTASSHHYLSLAELEEMGITAISS